MSSSALWVEIVLSLENGSLVVLLVVCMLPSVLFFVEKLGLIKNSVLLRQIEGILHEKMLYRFRVKILEIWSLIEWFPVGLGIPVIF